MKIDYGNMAAEFSRLEVTRNCQWYNDVNEMDQLLAFRCPTNQVIAGVKSRHDNHHEDRVFGFRCCELVERKLNYCSLTGFINEYDLEMNYATPHDYVISGFDSEHNDHHEDRRWKVDICEIEH
ncbi:hemagglutinin/amebocyte aggregation factor-like [Liolophura sinensis]|uniref:hemagglutinin/amebocyte aggregation factor-like n=1 Tax=Liolophura sinensis TaxID=3198878 RepID=UPI00315832A4